jgi:putative ABC transport system permease protein
MNLLQTMRTAIRALRRNKMRSFLTALGIIIGVGAVIAMVAIGEGAKAQVVATFASMGSNLLMVLSGATTAGGARGGYGSLPTLTWGDLKAIQSEVSSVDVAAPQMRISGQVIAEEQNWTTGITGTSSDFFTIRNWPIAKGELFPKEDTGAKVVVLGDTVSEQLFGANVDPVGHVVRMNKVPFQVIGLLAKKGQSPTGQDYDDAVFVPVRTFLTKLQGSMEQFIPGIIMVSAVSADATTRAQRQITTLLRSRHRLADGVENDFSIRNLAEMAAAMEASTNALTTLLAVIAMVSLLVGGIGIMNIMLVSVTERTREIGLRMAVGAKPTNILSQFLVEALTLSTAGGAVGVVLGIVGAGRLAAKMNWPLLVKPEIVLIAVGFSALVGIGFGLYPAYKASRLDPIEALRYE